MTLQADKIKYIYEELRLLDDDKRNHELLCDKILNIQRKLFPDTPVKHIPIAPGTESRHIAILVLALEDLRKDIDKE